MADPEPHLGPERGRQQFAGDLGHIDAGRGLQAIVAIAAAIRRILAEVPKQYRPAAAGRFDEHRQRVEPLALGRAALGLDLLLDPLASTSEILRRPKQPRLGRLAVAAGAAGLLVISLDALGDRGVRDQPDVGLVDAHAERDRRRDHHLLGTDECGLVAGAHLRLEPGMVGQCGRPLAPSVSAIFSALSRLGA